MGVSGGLVSWLRASGHDAVHLREQDLHRLPDHSVFDKAANEARIVLTFDLDFGEILALSRGRIVSVVLFRLNNTATAFVIGRMRLLCEDAVAVAALEAGAIVVVEDGRYRIRRLPLAG
jgi:predicted nuclease of predicted toxin-antitoxin system